VSAVPTETGPGIRAGDSWPGRSTHAVVDLDAIAANVRALKKCAGIAPLMTVVKGNAYGHGATMVSRPAPDKATVDGGSKTFCGDVVPARLSLQGYARAVGLDAYVETMSEEHGVVRLPPGADPCVGDRIAFHPIHVCTTVNLSDELIGVRGDRVEQVWPILARGKRT